jgi:SAM-dependent methyltransferase
MIPTGNNQPNIDRFLGFQEDYDRYRPQAPLIIPELLTSYLGDRPSLVADIGCGTGLSTFVWKNAADSAVGVEPNPDMLGKALDKLAQEADAASLSFVQGYSNQLPLSLRQCRYRHLLAVVPLDGACKHATGNSPSSPGWRSFRCI